MIFSKLRFEIFSVKIWKTKKMTITGSKATAVSLRYDGMARKKAIPISEVFSKVTASKAVVLPDAG